MTFEQPSSRRQAPPSGEFWRPAAWSLGTLAGLMWIIELIDFVTGRFIQLDGWGIRPRDIDYLLGIFFAPFLHIDFAHLATNTIPFLVLGGLIFLWDRRNFWLVSLVILLVSGLGTWLFGGPNSVHIGASGIVFGYLGFLLALGAFERSTAALSRALAVGFIYGGVLWGILPLQTGVSWQGHLFGFLGGIFAAYLFARRPDPSLSDQIKIDDF